MSDIAIRVEGLSKQYRIGRKQGRYKTLRDSLAAAATVPMRSLRSRFQRGSERRTDDDRTIWALEDVSFVVKRGEVVGVIGRNGAGKSTLLKLLSRITEPTKGYADIHGRVGSLLEVGTGFHHELTGRENIYLNGAIIGMRKAEIEHKFDEIVAFAEVERFIDMPVKHYSSGMYLRLAFSVAAHLEPEILLIDEVLAVGDVAFQKKCMGKMEDVAAHGRTVLFVSHNLGAIKELCQSGMVLNNGKLDFYGPVVEGLNRYSKSLVEGAGDAPVSGTGWRHVRVNGQSNSMNTSVAGAAPFFTDAQLDLREDFLQGYLYCIINNALGDIVVHQKVNSKELWNRKLAAGRYLLRTEFPALWLVPGVYTVYFKFQGHNFSGVEERHLSERVILNISGSMNGLGRAHLAPPSNWTFTAEPVLKSRLA